MASSKYLDADFTKEVVIKTACPISLEELKASSNLRVEKDTLLTKHLQPQVEQNLLCFT